MRRRMLALTPALLLVLSLLFSPVAGSTENRTAAPAPVATSCAHCITDRNACQAACNGNADCLATCQSEYECCLIICHGGSCRSRATKMTAATLRRCGRGLTTDFTPSHYERRHD